ncbi:hypothetical protein [Halorussus sp. AFM4]|uniref:hypothetical protein n=1 Tax=Halorussus sp. AFM4 TaxID=3421651 RepID=UPI003EBCF7E3
MRQMDEAALLPTLLYLLLTATAVAFAAWSLDWFRLTALSATAVALGLIIEGGVAYEGVRRAMR